MPTTLTGLLLFVVLLLPGFAYLVGKERNGTERRISPFRETVAIVAASVTCELVVLGIFAIIRGVWPSLTPDVGQLIRNAGTYLRGNRAQPGHYRQAAAWFAALLAAAVALAYTATLHRPRRIARRITGPYPHDSTVSAWWILFRRWPRGRMIEIACILDDGAMIRGRLGSFNIAADDSPDRDLVLREPIHYRPPGDDEEYPYDIGAVCVAARRITAMFVNYVDVSSPPLPVSSSPAEGQPSEASTAEPPQAPDPR